MHDESEVSGGQVGFFKTDSERLLGLVIRDLEGIVLPKVDDASASFTGIILVKLLRLLQARGTTGDLSQQADALGYALDRTALALIGREMEPAAAGAIPGAQAVAAISEAFSAVASAPALWRDLTAFAKARARLDLGGTLSSISESFAESGAGVLRKEVQNPVDALKLTADNLRRYLTSTFPNWTPITIEEFREVGTGSQKTIFFVTAATREGRFEWAVRQDKSFSSFDVSAVDEFPLLSRLHQAGLPVARPVWVADAGPVVGCALFATERLSGSANYSVWSADPAQAEPIIREVAAALARLHAVDPAGIGPAQKPLPGTVGGTPALRVAHLAEFWAGIGYQDPVVDACLAWLRVEAPESFGKLAVVHGDYAFHNLLIDQGHLTGILDWEFAHIGDAVEDLAYIRPFVQAMECWPAFLESYIACGGGALDERAMRFWGVVGMLRLAIGSFHNIQAVRDGVPGLDIRVANSGYLYAGLLLVEVTNMIEGSGAIHPAS